MIILQCYSLCERGYIDLWIVNYMGIFFSKWICENLRLSSNFPHCSNLCVKGAMFGWCSYVLEVKHHQGLLLMTKTKISSYFLKREGKHNLYLTFFFTQLKKELEKVYAQFFQVIYFFQPLPSWARNWENNFKQNWTIIFIFSFASSIFFVFQSNIKNSRHGSFNLYTEMVGFWILVLIKFVPCYSNTV